jgi:co-chaperonin GroES (HSP10)|tara:strand:- start:371 stop:631 length:261 start_codon:yes stop_codon:yes gene_type:complete
MKAVNHYVVVDKIKATEERKVGGLIISEEDDQENRYFKGTVVSVGNLVEGIKEKDIVWYDRHAGHGIEFENKFYFVIKAGDIVLVD